jgi:DNA polymerase III subunit epsilon
MIIAGFDTETTGLEIGDHRFVEVYAGLWNLKTQTKVFEFCTRINPERSIAAEASKIHKIMLSDVSDKPTWDRVAPALHKVLSKASMIVAHNGEDFDKPFVDYEFKRVGLPVLTVPFFDTMKQGRWSTVNGKYPNLGELCYACNVPYDTEKAHAADFDVEVMMRCFFFGLNSGFFKLPKELEVSIAA